MKKAIQILHLFNEKFRTKSNKLPFDIDKEFDYLNKTLFDNQVIKPPVLGFMTDKKKLGLTRNMTLNGKIYTSEILISDSYELTKPQFLSVLVHEMVHAIQDMKQIVSRGTEEAHSGFFITMRDLLNKKIELHGLNIAPITKTEQASEISTFADDKLKDKAGVVVVTDNKGQRLCAVFKLEVLLVNLKSLTSTIKKFYGEKSDIEYVKSDNGILKKYKITSKVNSFVLEGISEKDYETLKSDSEKIDDTLELDVASMPRLKKPLGIMLLRKPDGGTSIGVYELEGMKATIPDYIEKFTYGYKKNFELYFLSSDNILVNNYTVVKKDFKAIKMYGIPEGDFNTILKDGIIIDSVKL